MHFYVTYLIVMFFNYFVFSLLHITQLIRFRYTPACQLKPRRTMIPGEYKNASATLTDENNISIHALGIMATWENRKSSRAENPSFSIFLCRIHGRAWSVPGGLLAVLIKLNIFQALGKKKKHIADVGFVLKCKSANSISPCSNQKAIYVPFVRVGCN